MQFSFRLAQAGQEQQGQFVTYGTSLFVRVPRAINCLYNCVIRIIGADKFSLLSIISLKLSIIFPAQNEISHVRMSKLKQSEFS